MLSHCSPVTALLAEDDEDPTGLADAEKLVERWGKASPDRKGKVVAALMDVIVHKTMPGARIFDPDSIEIVWR
jgi:hypothetical protein